METNCPHCKASLDGGLIGPDLNSPYEYEGETKYPYGKGAHWERQIGIDIPEVYDGTIAWSCPDCKGTWPSEVGKLTSKKDSSKTLYELYVACKHENIKAGMLVNRCRDCGYFL